MSGEPEPSIKLGNNRFGEELALMQRGEKLMAAFCMDEQICEAEAMDHQNFGPELEAGRMIRFDTRHTSDRGLIRHVIITLAGEEWRAKAYMLLLDFLYDKGWSPELQWLEARLFGLSDDDAKTIVRTYVEAKQ